MRILLWIGNEANQRALANKIAEKFNIVGIVTESKKGNSKRKFSELPFKVLEKLFLSKIGKAWYGLLRYYEKQYPSYPSMPILDVENINSDEAYDFSINKTPDLIIVSGTRLIRKKMLSITPGIGILNLHTGLSPYVKGGPNCTNWCIANNQFSLIGNTIMWLDEGIDSGNLLATEFTSFTGSETLLEVHIKVMEHAHDLYLKCIDSLAKGKSKNIPQIQIAKGKTYYTKQWDFKQKIKLVQNFKKFKGYFLSSDVQKDRSNIKTVHPE